MNKTEALIQKIKVAYDKMTETKDEPLLSLRVEAFDRRSKIIEIPYLAIIDNHSYVRIIDYDDVYRMTGWYSFEQFKRLATDCLFEEIEEKVK